MKTSQMFLRGTEFKVQDLAGIRAIEPNLVFVFGGIEFFKSEKHCASLKAEFPDATVIGCSTAGEISGSGVSDNTLVITAMHSEKAVIRSARRSIGDTTDSFTCGRGLGLELASPDLTAIFVLGRGVQINGVSLVEGLKMAVGADVVVTGGLAGDSGHFTQTWTYLDGASSDHEVVAIGLYGKGLSVGYGSVGGWKPFGPARVVTKSSGNIVHEIDGSPALEVYRKYLGDDAKNLPGSGLRYPFAILNGKEDNTGVIRTIFGVDEKAGSLTFGGDIPTGSLVRLMHSDHDSLIAGARLAAESSRHSENEQKGLGILVSCVGRRLVLGDDIDNEVEAVREVLGKNTHLGGFYSNGEISPETGSKDARLHNQTMTITWFVEAA